MKYSKIWFKPFISTIEITENVFFSFEIIHRFLCEDLKDDADNPTLKAQLSHLANSYTITNHQYQLLQNIAI